MTLTVIEIGFPLEYLLGWRHRLLLLSFDDYL